uniref:Uncharacterized protein n=1 Tax=viral metagenome TaxID=1070528 RepID=A0A6M3JUN4_9ZZZZ
MPPLLADDVLKLLCVPEARYFFNLFEKQEHQQGKKNYVGIAGLLQYGQRHGGRDLFISIKPDILSEYPDGFRTAIENLRFWYFANFSDPFLYMTRIAADPFNDVIEALASRKYEGDKIWAQGQWRETERFELQAP